MRKNEKWMRRKDNRVQGERGFKKREWWKRCKELTKKIFGREEEEGKGQIPRKRKRRRKR